MVPDQSPPVTPSDEPPVITVVSHPHMVKMRKSLIQVQMGEENPKATSLLVIYIWDNYEMPSYGL